LGSATPPHRKRAEIKVSHLYVFVPTALKQKYQIRHGNTHYVEGRVLGGYLRLCICTNASRGLSATAPFLVLLTLPMPLDLER